MKKIEKINAREKEVYKLLIATFIAKINYKYYKNKGIKTYNSIYISSFDTFNINDKDKQDIFNEAEVILEQQEKLIFAHYDADKPLYMVKL